jgi:hypothetical protein
MGARSSSLGRPPEPNKKTVREQAIETFYNLKEKLQKKSKFHKQTLDTNPVYVRGTIEYPIFQGKYESLQHSDTEQYFFKHEKHKLYLYKSKSGTWFLSKHLWSKKATYWTRESLPGPTFPAQWYYIKNKKVEKVSDQFLVEREFVDVIPPTPTTSRRLNVCASTEVFHESDAKILIFRAFSRKKSDWLDPFFHVDEQGDNNFQESESRALNIHYNTKSLVWKCIWDGDIYYNVHDFEVTWQKQSFQVQMNFKNSIDLNDISQGDVGDCWLLSSIIAVVNFGQNLIDEIICTEENLKNPNGPFKFKFHKCGKWHTVYVDNSLPMCGTARSAYYSMIKQLFDRFYNRPSEIEQTDFWVPLLEKAFAKFCGSYRTLIAGHPVRGLSYLTGGICVRMTLDDVSITSFENNQGTSSFFDWLQNNLNKVMCCTSSRLRPDGVPLDERTNSLGIAYNHAYSLLRAQVVTLNTKKAQHAQLLKIRNPWNKKGNKSYETEWQGDWSDKSKLWRFVDENSRTELPVCKDDGEFWISRSDWLKQFRVVDICYPPIFFENFSKYEIRETAIRGKNCEYWSKGSHARHFTPSPEWPVESLILLNEDNGFNSYKFGLSGSGNQLYIQMMFDLNYNDRLTWLKTLLLFDIERNMYLTPFLGECHDLVTSNDSVIFHIPSAMETDESNYRRFVLQFKLSPKESTTTDILDYIIRIYYQSSVKEYPETTS